jgi:hypothetical protein
VSRGRQRNDFHRATAPPGNRDDVPHAPEVTRDAVVTLAASIGRNATQQMVLESERGIS